MPCCTLVTIWIAHRFVQKKFFFQNFSKFFKVPWRTTWSPWVNPDFWNNQDFFSQYCKQCLGGHKYHKYFGLGCPEGVEIDLRVFSFFTKFAPQIWIFIIYLVDSSLWQETDGIEEWLDRFDPAAPVPELLTGEGCSIPEVEKSVTATGLKRKLSDENKQLDNKDEIKRLHEMYLAMFDTALEMIMDERDP